MIVQERETRKAEAETYLGQRTGTYEYRTKRYAVVADELEAMGLDDGHLIVDVGAGWGDFDRYLRCTRGFGGRYLPVDACLDGTDLEWWRPVVRASFFTAIETLEHLHSWRGLATAMEACALRGIVVTTPNTDELGDAAVREMDDTHVSPIRAADLEERGYGVRAYSLFARNAPRVDTLVGVWRRR